MKFKVSAKDLVIFVIFILLLLYLCAILVVNFVTFANDGAFHGLSPFKAFSGDYLAVTLIVFFAMLIIIFASVSSYIFGKDGNGFGLSVGEKEDKGYSRWSKANEIKKNKNVAQVDPLSNEITAAGIPLINNGKRIWVDNGEYHNLVIGSTGSGKTETIVKPMVNLLAKKGESMIITDPKGEIFRYSASALRDRGYRIVLLNFRDPQRGNAWNPLSLPYKYYQSKNYDKATELLDDVALNIIYDPNNKNDPFWEKSAADYFSGLALGLFEDANEAQININSINYMATVGEEKFAAGNYIKEYFTMKGESSNPYVFASNTINAPTDTKGSILSVFRQKIRLFASRENLSEMLGHSDFDIRDIGNGKTAVFIVIHDEKTTYHSLVTIFIKQCYEALIDVAQENGGKLKYRTNFILDEFANMPPLKDVDSMVSAARSRDMRFTFIIQNFAQLNDVYGKEVAQVIRGNCGNTIYLISTELAALEEISKMAGEVKSKDKDKTASTPLVTVTDLQKLKLFEAIIMRLRMSPFKTQLEPDFKMNWGITRKVEDYPQRDMEEVKLFELKEFVKEIKKQKMLESLENNKNNPDDVSGGSPFGPMGANPFMNPMQSNPFAPPTSASPMAQSVPGTNPFAPPPANPFAGGLENLDLDAMMRDIDKKIAELDAEEARQKELLAQKQKEAKVEPTVDIPKPEVAPVAEMQAQTEKPVPPVAIADVTSAIEAPKPAVSIADQLTQSVVQPEPLKVEVAQPIENKEIEKPKVNVDRESVIVNENLVSDDEFFDDFFGDD